MVVVAVKEQSQFEILQRLEHMGFNKMVVVDPLVWQEIKENKERER